MSRPPRRRMQPAASRLDPPGLRALASALANRRPPGGMKIAIVIGSLRRGGSERQVVELVRATHRTHAECVVLCLGDRGELAEEVEEVGARVIRLGMSRLTAPGALVRLVRVLRRERPDVVYAF